MTDKPREPVWRIPLRWLGDESWWRDATSNAMGTGIVVLITFLVGLVLGYFRLPYALDGLADLIGIAAVVLAVLSVAVTVRIVLRNRKDPNRRALLASIPFTVMLVVLICLEVAGEFTSRK